MFTMISSVLVFYILIGAGYAFEEGAPAGACIDMYPRHGYDPQSGNGGFKITLSTTTVTGGSTVDVTLSGTSKFEGFIMRAEQINGNIETALGSFTTLPKNTKAEPWYPASGDWKTGFNCVTHSDELEVTTLTFTWTAPATITNMGDIQFRATALTDFEVFYINILSAKLTTGTTAPAWSGAATEKTLASAPSPPSECGTTMGCLAYPRWCMNTGSCTTFLSWKSSANSVDFSLSAPATGYVSVGISADTDMENTQTFTCSYQTSPKSLLIQNGYNPPNVDEGMMNFRHPIPAQMKNLVVSKAGSNIYCSFTLPKTMPITMQTSFTKNPNTYAAAPPTDLTKSYYYFIAQGSLYPGTNVIKEHEGLPVTSDSKIDLTQNTVYYGQAIPIMVRAHGALMIIAWLLIACFCMATARYMKQGFGNMVKGVKLWFHLHKFGMALTYVLGFIGVVVILVFAEGWISATNATIHGVFGLICMIVATAQVCSGILRPGLDHPNRPIFLWFHRIAALTCFVTASITIFIVGFVSALPVPFKKIMLGCAIFWIILNIVFIIVFELIGRTSKAPEGPATDSTMQIAEPEKSGTTKSKIVIVIYVVCLICLTLVTIVSMCAY